MPATIRGASENERAINTKWGSIGGPLGPKGSLILATQGIGSQVFRLIVVALVGWSLGLASVPADHDEAPRVEVPPAPVACPPPVRAAASGTCTDAEAQVANAQAVVDDQESSVNGGIGTTWNAGFDRARDASRDSPVVVWTDVNDGSGSGLDADRLDGTSGEQFLRSDRSGTLAGDLTVTGRASAAQVQATAGGFLFPDGTVQDSTARTVLLASERLAPGKTGGPVVPPTIQGVSTGPGVGGLVLVEAYREYVPNVQWGCSETWLLLYNSGHHGAMWNTGVVIAHSYTSGLWGWACDAGVQLRGQNSEPLETTGDWVVGGFSLQNASPYDVTWRAVMWR